jgi:hypothetical protein
MTKPTDDISWATDTDYPAGSDPWDATATCVEPSSGRKASGWEPNQKPTAQELNWWERGAARWIQWLAGNVADLQFGIPMCEFQLVAGTLGTGSGTSHIENALVTPTWRFQPGGTDQTIQAPVHLPIGATISSFIFEATQPDSSDGFSTYTFKLRKQEMATGTVSDVFTGGTSGYTIGAPTVTDTDIASAPYTIEAGFSYWVEVTMSSSSDSGYDLVKCYAPVVGYL